MLLSPLPESFYNRPVLELTPALLGTRLIRRENGLRVGGYITEVEAYSGESDLACHARAGRTARTEVMYGPPGRVYMYFIYGMHWMLNVVAEAEDSPAAILIRGLLPSEGLAQIAAQRSPAPPRNWTNGPARLCQALKLDGQMNGVDLTQPDSPLRIEPGWPVPSESVSTGPRVGINNVPEPWRSKPWRFRIDLQSWNLPTDANRV